MAKKQVFLFPRSVEIHFKEQRCGFAVLIHWAVVLGEDIGQSSLLTLKP